MLAFPLVLSDFYCLQNYNKLRISHPGAEIEVERVGFSFPFSPDLLPLVYFTLPYILDTRV